MDLDRYFEPYIKEEYRIDKDDKDGRPLFYGCGNIVPKCPRCEKHVRLKDSRREMEFKFERKKVTYLGYVPHCKECGHELKLKNYDEYNHRLGDEVYREEFNIITVEEIKELLDLLETNHHTLSFYLGWGTDTIGRYLRGTMPSKRFSDILKDLSDNFERTLEWMQEKNNMK